MISFDRQGRRYNFSLDVLEMTSRSELVQIGTWSDTIGLSLASSPVIRNYPVQTKKLT